MPNFFPDDPNLPFFAYGAFRQGELAFLRIKPFVRDLDTRAIVLGTLRVRDGLLLLSPDGTANVPGHLVTFDQHARQASPFQGEEG